MSLAHQIVPAPHDSVVAHQIAEHGAIYCIGTRPGGLLKIGFSTDPGRRVKQLQTGNGEPLKIITFIPGTQSLERGLHETFADLRVNGEWFVDRNFEISSTLSHLLHLFRTGALSL